MRSIALLGALALTSVACGAATDDPTAAPVVVEALDGEPGTCTLLVALSPRARVSLPDGDPTFCVELEPGGVGVVTLYGETVYSPAWTTYLWACGHPLPAECETGDTSEP